MIYIEESLKVVEINYTEEQEYDKELREQWTAILLGWA